MDLDLDSLTERVAREAAIEVQGVLWEYSRAKENKRKVTEHDHLQEKFHLEMEVAYVGLGWKYPKAFDEFALLMGKSRDAIESEYRGATSKDNSLVYPASHPAYGGFVPSRRGSFLLRAGVSLTSAGTGGAIGFLAGGALSLLLAPLAPGLAGLITYVLSWGGGVVGAGGGMIGAMYMYATSDEKNRGRDQDTTFLVNMRRYHDRLLHHDENYLSKLKKHQSSRK